MVGDFSCIEFRCFLRIGASPDAAWGLRPTLESAVPAVGLEAPLSVNQALFFFLESSSLASKNQASSFVKKRLRST